MAKLILGNAPKTFKSLVEIPQLDKSVATVEMEFKYRTRTEFGALMDSIINKVQPVKGKKAKPASDDEVNKTLKEMFAEGNASNVDYILQIAEGWDIEQPFGEEWVSWLADNNPNAINAISEAYREAISEGRTKN